jgi:hypothetical protein
MNNTINHECQLKKVDICPSNICIGLFAEEKGELMAALYGHKEEQKQPANESRNYAYSRLLGLLLQKERVKSV